MGDWKQAALVILFAAKLGLAAGILAILFNLFFALHDKFTEIWSIFGLYLLIFAGAEVWVRARIRKLAEDPHEYKARHRSKIRSTMDEISEMHASWRKKKAEDYDERFTDWVAENKARPTWSF